MTARLTLPRWGPAMSCEQAAWTPWPLASRPLKTAWHVHTGPGSRWPLAGKALFIRQETKTHHLKEGKGVGECIQQDKEISYKCVFKGTKWKNTLWPLFLPMGKIWQISVDVSLKLNQSQMRVSANSMKNVAKDVLTVSDSKVGHSLRNNNVALSPEEV